MSSQFSIVKKKYAKFIYCNYFCFFISGDGPLSLDVFEAGIATNAELWGLLQPYEHLICGRNSSGKYSKEVKAQAKWSN